MGRKLALLAIRLVGVGEPSLCCDLSPSLAGVPGSVTLVSRRCRKRSTGLVISAGISTRVQEFLRDWC